MSIVNPHDPGSWPIGYKREKSELRVPMNMAQETALRTVYDRQPLNKYAHAPKDEHEELMTWGKFRDSAEKAIGSDPAVMIYWCGMWLGIEPDGHVHS